MIIQNSFLVVFTAIAFVFYELNAQNNTHKYLSLFTDTFSQLGRQEPWKNPNGWYYFSIALISQGLLFEPIMMFYYQKFRIISIKLAKVGLGFLIFSIINIGLIGVFCDGQNYIFGFNTINFHQAVSNMGYGSAVIGFILYFVILCRDYNGCCKKCSQPEESGKQTYKFKLISIPFFIVFIGLFLLLFFLLAWQIAYPIYKQQDPSTPSWPGEGIFAFPLWEWITIISVFISAALLFAFLPIPSTITLQNQEINKKSKQLFEAASENIDIEQKYQIGNVKRSVEKMSQDEVQRLAGKNEGNKSSSNSSAREQHTVNTSTKRQ